MSKTTHPRHRLRIAAMQVLFQLDAQGDEFREQIDDFLESEAVGTPDRPFVHGLVDGAWNHRTRIDEMISAASQHWELQRITPVDRAILRLAAGEMLAEAGTPPKVAINEAIELAKVFGAAESPQFVNGLLDAIWRQLQSQS